MEGMRGYSVSLLVIFFTVEVIFLGSKKLGTANVRNVHHVSDGESAASHMMGQQELFMGKRSVPKRTSSKQLALELENSEFIGGRGFASKKKKPSVSQGDRAAALFGSIGQGQDDAFAQDLDSGYLSL